MNAFVAMRSCTMAVLVLVPLVCDAGQHPVPLDAKSECVDCHSDHSSGVYIHAAVKQGCSSCHEVENRTDGTYVELKPTKSVACFECHQAKNYSYGHLPYSSGMCLRCHTPHTSANAHLLRSKVNEVCLDCHLRHPGNVPSRYMPTIVLVSDNSMGHPYERHPVSKARDALTGEEMSCLSCHQAHGAMQPHLLRMGAEIPEDALNQNTETNDMCRKCHTHMWGLDRLPAKKKNKAKAN
jgi:predicted CXXCH cytochrome family protein